MGARRDSDHRDCACYDSVGGSVIQTGSGTVELKAYEGEWAEVQELGTGAQPYWVHSAVWDLPE
ncbi:MAG: hypothetical protein ACI4O5_07025 [Oscillospiraceae bacterium]